GPAHLWIDEIDAVEVIADDIGVLQIPRAACSRTAGQGVIDPLEQLVDGYRTALVLVKGRTRRYRQILQSDVHADDELIDGDLAIVATVADTRLGGGAPDGTESQQEGGKGTECNTNGRHC